MYYNKNCSDMNYNCEAYEQKANLLVNEANSLQKESYRLAAIATGLDEKYLQLKPQVLAVWAEGDSLNEIANQKIDYSNDALRKAADCYECGCDICTCKKYENLAKTFKEEAQVMYAKSKELGAKGAALNEEAKKVLDEADNTYWKEVDRLDKLAKEKRTEAANLYNKAIECYKDNSSNCGCSCSNYHDYSCGSVCKCKK